VGANNLSYFHWKVVGSTKNSPPSIPKTGSKDSMNSFLFGDDFNERSLALFAGNRAHDASNGANYATRLADHLANIFLIAFDVEASNTDFDIFGDFDRIRIVYDALNEGLNQFGVGH